MSRMHRSQWDSYFPRPPRLNPTTPRLYFVFFLRFHSVQSPQMGQTCSVKTKAGLCNIWWISDCFLPLLLPLASCVDRINALPLTQTRCSVLEEPCQRGKCLQVSMTPPPTPHPQHPSVGRALNFIVGVLYTQGLPCKHERREQARLCKQLDQPYSSSLRCARHWTSKFISCQNA